jgi:peptidoglycan hydrolase-like protein with peptidoglycan-binding domain
VPIEGIPVSLAGSVSDALSSASAFSVGGGISNTWGNRDVTGSSLQELHDRTRQATSALRTLSSTVVVQTSQRESSTVETRTVTNHNHCHSLTMMYYEVLRHFRVVTSFMERQPVILLPYRPIRFTWQLALRFRSTLELLVGADLAGCFDALVRLHKAPGIYEEPDEKQGPPAGGGGSTSTTEKVSYYQLSLRTTDWNWSTTWGRIAVSLGLADGSWVPLYSRMSVNEGGTELPKGEFTTQINASGPSAIDPRTITRVRVQWTESNGNDSWDFKGITVLYGVAGKSQVFSLLAQDGTVAPGFTRSGRAALKYFDDSGPGTAQEWIGTVSPPEPVEETTEPEPSTSAPQLTTPGAPQRFSKQRDELCEQLLLEHLNANLGLYNSAIWLLQNPVERRSMFDSTLPPEILAAIDDAPLAVAGTMVAFGYNGDPEPLDFEPSKPLSEITALPTRGVFAEAQLGSCNACEVRDVTRFWQWEEHPCGSQAPTIEGITPGPSGAPTQVTPTTLPTPVVQITNVPTAPDPTGLSAGLELLGTANLFRDMSGMSSVQALLDGLVKGTVTLAQAEALAKDAQKAGAKPPAPSGAGGAAGGNTTKPAAQRFEDLQVAKEVAKAAGDLGWSPDTTARVTETVFTGVTTGSGSGGPPAAGSPVVTLGASVGPPSDGGKNAKDDVLTVQSRLASLGFSWLTVDGSFGAQTERAIRLFQAIIRGQRVLDGNASLDGLIDFPGPTYSWLRAVNAPRWIWQPQGSAAEGFYNVEHAEPEVFDYGTDWAADVIRGAGAAYKPYYDLRVATGTGTALIMINDVSPERGGDALGHKGHETGLDVDLRLPRVNGGTQGGLKYTDPDYDQATMREMLRAVNDQSLVKIVRFNDPDLVDENLCVADTTGEHDNHAHVEIVPPLVGPVQTTGVTII